TVNADSFAYGGSPTTPYGGTVSGLVAGDTSNGKGVIHTATVRRDTPTNDISVTYALDPTIVSASSSVGTYPNGITASVSGSASGNYSVTVVPATVTIGQASLTVTVNADSFTYGGSPTTPYGGTVSGLVNGDTSNGKGVIHSATVRRDTPTNDISVTYALDPTIVSATSN